MSTGTLLNDVNVVMTEYDGALLCLQAIQRVPVIGRETVTFLSPRMKKCGRGHDFARSCVHVNRSDRVSVIIHSYYECVMHGFQYVSTSRLISVK